MYQEIQMISLEILQYQCTNMALIISDYETKFKYNIFEKTTALLYTPVVTVQPFLGVLA